MADKKYLDHNGLIQFLARLYTKFARYPKGITAGQGVVAKTVEDDIVTEWEAVDLATQAELESMKSSIDSTVSDITSGNTVVKEAEHAESADKATTADSATNANHAITADTATNANHAATADSATNAANAENAEKADYATEAGNANYAASAGSAASATKATQDGDGNVITDTYQTIADATSQHKALQDSINDNVEALNDAIDLKADVTDFNESIIALSVEGTTVTYIKGDGSTHTFETQDTDTTYYLGTDTVTGLTKLYATIGSAEDGTMTQKAIKTELDKKVGVAIDGSQNALVFTV